MSEEKAAYRKALTDRVVELLSHSIETGRVPDVVTYDILNGGMVSAISRHDLASWEDLRNGSAAEYLS